MAIGDVWYYDLGKTPMIEVGLRKGHYLISGKAQFDQIPGLSAPNTGHLRRNHALVRVFEPAQD